MLTAGNIFGTQTCVAVLNYGCAQV